MKRIAIIGCPGAGKSTVAVRLARLTGLPLFHLDTTYHDTSKWSADIDAKRQQWRLYQEALVQKDEWIIDGNYRRTLDLRVAAADTILYLNYPRWLCLMRALLRSLQWYITKRSVVGGNPGSVDTAFLRFIWSYQRTERAMVLELLAKYPCEKQIRIFTDPKQTEQFLRRLESRGNCNG